ncbi:MAG: hypothetical protein ACW980_24145 [Promethearchaeota archaeon]|jgi:hypothetical protein
MQKRIADESTFNALVASFMSNSNMNETNAKKEASRILEQETKEYKQGTGRKASLFTKLAFQYSSEIEGNTKLDYLSDDVKSFCTDSTFDVLHKSVTGILISFVNIAYQAINVKKKKVSPNLKAIFQLIARRANQGIKACDASGLPFNSLKDAEAEHNAELKKANA